MKYLPQRLTIKEKGLCFQHLWSILLVGFLLSISSSTLYSLSCEDPFYEPNETIYAADETAIEPLSINPSIRTFTGLISGPFDQDYYKLPIQSKGKVNIRLYSLPEDYNLEILSVFGEVLFQSNNTGTNDESITFQNDETQSIYYIHIYSALGDFDCIDTYKVRVFWQPDPCRCPSTVDPVCGSDGVNYTNPCFAECAGVDYIPGRCPCNCPTNIISEVCGSDGVTYQNVCFAECAGVTWTIFACDPCNCSDEYDPVCGSDGVTYSNACEAECVGVSYSTGECGCNCNDVYDPVCGSDGVTYSNACEAECAGVTWSAGECGCVCPQVYDPVCGSDGVTYPNACEAECAGVTWVEGICTGNATCECTSPFDNTICENFENYTLGTLATQSSCWTTASGAIGGVQDGQVARLDNNQYLLIEGGRNFFNQPNTILQLGNRNSGRYSLTFRLFIEDRDRAFYQLFHTFNAGASNNQVAHSVYFNGNGNGQLRVGGIDYYFAYFTGQWIEVRQDINLSNHTSTLFVGGNQVHQWPFAYQANAINGGIEQIAALNFSSFNATYEYFVDEIEFEKISSIDEVDERNNKAKEILDPNHLSLEIYPNPVVEQLQMELNSVENQPVSLVLINAHGEKILEREYEGDLIHEQLNMKTYPAGVYVLQIRQGEKMIIKKVVKQ